MPTERMRRVNMVLREVLAEGVEALEDPGLGFVTITAVRATSDLSQADVYVSVLGSERRRGRSLRVLERAHGVLQSRIARELHFKRTPHLSFHYDESLDQAMRLEELISRAQEPPAEAQSGMTDIALETDLESVVAALAAADRVLISTHENPDGDAIGSMSAAAAAMQQLGKQVRTFLEPESTIPHEVAFLDTGGVERQVDPATLEGWTLLALDCGNERRMGAQYTDLLAGCSPVIDVDHHHDNSRFGHMNLIDGRASSTAEILVRIFDRLGVEVTPAIAESLYVGLVTDTGRFQYRTTSPAALRLGARLVEAGVDVHKVFERVFESVQPGKLRLLGRVIDHAVPYCDGRVLISHVSRDDLALVEGDEATTEGLIDHLRAVEGVQVAGLIREQVPLADGSLAPNRVSLRSRGLIDVSAIARLSAGGGHKQAAGFSHPGSVDDIRRFVVTEVTAQLAESAA
jgi:bifunctional oligoribonuclease and PAP phosphatase NrnA